MTKKNTIILTTGLILIALLFILTSDVGRYLSYYASKPEYFNNDDKLYLKKEFLNTSIAVPTYRAVRPLTMDEYEITHYLYAKEDADAEYKQIVFQNDFFLIDSFQDIDKVKLKKTGSSYLGTYKGLYLLKIQDPTTKVVSKDFFYKISINKSVVNNRDSLAVLPTDYFWEDDQLFIPIQFAGKN